MARHYKFWTTFCNDRTVLKHVGGISIPLVKKVNQTAPVREIHMNDRERKFVRQKLQQLIDCGCIVKLKKPIKNGWLSNIFLRPKKDGTYRIILNLKPLNEFIEYKKFKMPTISNVTRMIRRSYKMISVDILDAYSHTKICRKDRCLLQFKFEGTTYMYKVLPNGIAVGPRFFVQMTKAIASYLRRLGVQIIIYIDDTIVVGPDVQAVERDRDLVISTLENCGFTVNREKSHLTPCTSIEFLGFILNSEEMTIKLTEVKRRHNRDMVANMLQNKHQLFRVRSLAKLIGLIVSIFPCSSEAPLHYRTLERKKIAALKSWKKWSAKLRLDKECVKELHWWHGYLASQPFKSLIPLSYSTNFYSDASGFGWGALIEGHNANGPFSEKQKMLSINTKELLAIYFGLSSLGKFLRGKNVICFCDNTTAVSCLTKFGSQDRTRDKITVWIFQLASDLDIHLTGTHLARTLNSGADSLSRKEVMNERLEWTMAKTDMQFILDSLSFQPDIDLFASHLNFQIKSFCSFRPDPEAMHVNAFTLNWKSWKPYVFAPFNLLDRCLAKIEADKVENIAMVVPLWLSAPFFATMLRHLKKAPVMLPKTCTKYLTLPWNKEKRHPVKSLRLVLVHLCATCYAPSRYHVLWQNTLPGTQE